MLNTIYSIQYEHELSCRVKLLTIFRSDLKTQVILHVSFFNRLKTPPRDKCLNCPLMGRGCDKLFLTCNAKAANLKTFSLSTSIVSCCKIKKEVKLAGGLSKTRFSAAYLKHLPRQQAPSRPILRHRTLVPLLPNEPLPYKHYRDKSLCRRDLTRLYAPSYRETFFKKCKNQQIVYIY